MTKGIPLRLPDELHDKITRNAKKHNISVNKLMISALENELDPKQRTLIVKQDTPNENIRIRVGPELTKQARAVAGRDAPAWLRECLRKGVSIELRMSKVVDQLLVDGVRANITPELE